MHQLFVLFLLLQTVNGYQHNVIFETFHDWKVDDMFVQIDQFKNNTRLVRIMPNNATSIKIKGSSTQYYLNDEQIGWKIAKDNNIFNQDKFNCKDLICYNDHETIGQGFIHNMTIDINEDITTEQKQIILLNIIDKMWEMKEKGFKKMMKVKCDHLDTIFVPCKDCVTETVKGLPEEPLTKPTLVLGRKCSTYYNDNRYKYPNGILRMKQNNDILKIHVYDYNKIICTASVVGQDYRGLRTGNMGITFQYKKEDRELCQHLITEQLRKHHMGSSEYVLATVVICLIATFCYIIRFWYLKTKMNKTNLECGICMEEKPNVMFQCGHLVCKDCSRKITDCPICRETITDRRNIYL